MTLFRLSPAAIVGLLALGSANALLLTLATSAVSGDPDPTDPRAQWSPAVSASVEGVPPSKPISAYQRILAEPVFFRTRQPFVPPPPPIPPPSQPLPIVTPPEVAFVDPGFVLGGIVVTGDLKKAYLFTKADPDGTWATEGEEIAEWMVTSIDTASARLKKGSHTLELFLYER